MNEKDLITDAFNAIPADSTIFISKLTDIADRVQQLLDEKDWTQKDLAEAMGKRESEISKWLTSIHNFTLKSIAKMEAALGADIINVPLSGEISCATNYVYLKVFARSNDPQMDKFEETPVSQNPRLVNEQYLSILAEMNSLKPSYPAQSLKEEVVENEHYLIAS
jgi:transcriptional regulator with XRE-family HTH domain